MSLEEIKRIPIPDPATLDETRLAAASDDLAQARRRLQQDGIDEYRATYEVAAGVPSLRPSAAHVGTRATPPLLRMSDLILRGELVITGPANQSIGAALGAGRVTAPGHPPELIEAVELLLRERGGRMADAIATLDAPEPPAAAHFLAMYQAAQQRLADLLREFLEARARVDALVFEWYGIPGYMRDTMSVRFSWQSEIEDFLGRSVED